MYVVNGSDGRCIVAVRLIVGVRYLERPLREVLLYMLGAKHGFGQSMDCATQTTDSYFARQSMDCTRNPRIACI